MNKDDWTNLTDSDFSSEGEDDGGYESGKPAQEERPQQDYFESRDNQRDNHRGNYRDNYRDNQRGNYRDNYRDNNSRSRGGYNRGYRNNNYKPRQPESQPKDVILDYCKEAGDLEFYWLNLFNFSTDASEDQIMEFYSSIPALDVYSNHGMRLAMDIKFKSIEDLGKAVDLGTTDGKVDFMIRWSKIFPFGYLFRFLFGFLANHC